MCAVRLGGVGVPLWARSPGCVVFAIAGLPQGGPSQGCEIAELPILSMQLGQMATRCLHPCAPLTDCAAGGAGR